MGAVKIDSVKIKGFRGELSTLVENLNKALKETEYAVDQVALTWKDNGFRQFCLKFDEDKKEIKPLCDKISDFESSYLSDRQRKAEAIEGHLA
jgi:hypothetical protein